MTRPVPILAHLILMLLVALPAHGNWRDVEGLKEFVGDSEPKESGLMLELPSVSEDGSNITMNLNFNGTLNDDEYLQEIRVFAPGNPSSGVVDFELSEAITKPAIRTRIRLAESQTVYAVARSNQDRTWLQSREVRVTVSGCLMDDGDPGELRMQSPRVALGNSAQAGQPLPIRTMINHPMETGLRDGEDDEDIEEQLVESMTVRQGDQQVFRARFHSGTAANPFVMFHLTPKASGDLKVIWEDQNGDQVEQDESLSL